MSRGKFLVVTLGDFQLGLALEDILQLVHLPELVRLPKMGSCLEGFLNFRGRAIPTLRLDRLLTEQELEIGLYTPVVLTNNALALVVEGIRTLVTVEQEELLELEGEHLLRAWGSQQFLLDGESVFLLDPHKLLSEREASWLEEKQRLAESEFGT